MERISYLSRVEGDQLNSYALDRELTWLGQVIEMRFGLYFGNQGDPEDIKKLSPPDIANDHSRYAEEIRKHDLSFEERLVLILALSPHVRPHLLDPFFTKNSSYERGFTEFGGIKGENHGGFLPTGETAAFLLGTLNLDKRTALMKIFDPRHIFYKHNILKLEPTRDHEPILSGALVMHNDYIDLFTIGEARRPTFSSKFPASLIETRLGWDDLVLDSEVRDQVDHILSWINHQDLIMKEWALDTKIKPGYRALFYGPPGTGKTLTASLLGKSTSRDVYRIDVSMVVSKWVGETEKNLARVFDMAEGKDWILFFDEADSLFGKRSDTSSSQERYANQEVSYLLQRTEEYPGVVILASNLKGNIDEAFTRRFQSMVHFQMPSDKQRLVLWNKAFDSHLQLEPGVDLKQIAKDFVISGGAIVNALKYTAIKAAHSGKPEVSKQFLIEGIRNELEKEGKTG